MINKVLINIYNSKVVITYRTSPFLNIIRLKLNYYSLATLFIGFTSPRKLIPRIVILSY